MRCLVVIVAAISLNALGCMNRTVNVGTNRFIVPCGFRGAIRVESHPDGIEPCRSKPDTLTYVVPSNGILSIAGELPFDSFRRCTASYEDGSPLPTRYETPSTDADSRVTLFIVRSDGTGLWMYVGTAQEREAAFCADLEPGKRVDLR
jgi:hypothetical protein